ncbi:MAG: GGDEF domain-containing protein [Chromatiales bacterium]|nr:GGDEF domain-containing protein [Chromatiales bacterium]
MSHPIFRRIAGFFLPAGLLFVVMVVLAGYGPTATRLGALADIYFYVALIFALLLGWRFDRSLLVFSTVVIGLAVWLLNDYGNRGDAIGRILSDVVAVLLPLNLLLLSVCKERGIITLHGLLRWGVLLLQALLVWLLFHFKRFDWLGLFDTTYVKSLWLEELALYQPALLAFILALIFSCYRAIRHPTPLSSAMFWAIALLFVTLLQGHDTALTSALFASAIVILLVAVIEISYSMAFRDELTGLTGRRALNQALLKLGSRYTIAMLDVDHFKKFNDTYGHDVGDEVLQMVAARMSQVTGGGRVYRYGGEEFTVLFPGKGVDHALPHLEALRESIANSGFTVREKGRPGTKPEQRRKGSEKQVQITVSIGVAEREGELREPEAVIKEADKALYRAKKGGRNRVAT